MLVCTTLISACRDAMIFAKENHMTQVALETDCQVMVELW
jgi:ribonuclease HI